jgi:hypothetical protein
LPDCAFHQFSFASLLFSSCSFKLSGGEGVQRRLSKRDIDSDSHVTLENP